MTPRSVTLRRVAVGTLALATASAGLPVLLGGAANAAAPQRLTITQDDTRSTAAAGTCTAFSATATDPFGGPADAATITVTIAENPASDSHDVDFCTITNGSAFVNAPQYTNATSPGATPVVPAPGTPQTYTAGPSITAPDMNSGGNPDGASGAMGTNSTNSNNPTGSENASFRTVDGVARFGVVGLLPGAGATINAFVDDSTQRTRDNNGDGDVVDATDDQVVAPQRTVTFTAGGRPGTEAANNAATRVELRPDESIAAKPNANDSATHSFTLQAFNSNGDVLGGITQARIIATAGPNAPSGTNQGTFSGSCEPSTTGGQTGNQGQPASCTYRASTAGTDTVTGFINQSTGSPTFGLDATEPRDSASAVTTPPATNVTAEARNIVLTPADATIPAGEARDFTAAVTNASGAPVNDVSIRFEENGPGAFANPTATSAATSTVVMSTTGAGRRTVRFLTSTTDRGSNTITATIITTGTQCSQQASGTTSAGNCSDSSPVTITASAASPSASASARPSASASASARPSGSTSPRPSTTATGAAPGCQVVAQTRLERSTITATGSAGVTVTATQNSVVDLLAYSRPSTTFRVVRSAEVGADGVADFRITPPTNTRLFAQQRGCAAGPQVVLNVRTQLSLNVVRNGTRNYTFSGSAIPARPNGLIVSLYRVESDGRQILTAQTRANANTGQPGFDPSRPAGSYSIRRQFTGSGRFGFVVRTGQDLQNAPGTSNVRSLAVF